MLNIARLANNAPMEIIENNKLNRSKYALSQKSSLDILNKGSMYANLAFLEISVQNANKKPTINKLPIINVIT